MNAKTFSVTDIFSQSLLIMAMFCVIVAVIAYFRGRNSRASFHDAVAKVTEIREETLQAKDETGAMTEQGPFRIVYVEYETQAGIKNTARLTDVLSSTMAGYPVGALIPIQYNPEALAQIRQAGFCGNYGLEFFISFCAVVFFLCSIGIRFLSKDLAGMDLAQAAKDPVSLFISSCLILFGSLCFVWAVWSMLVHYNADDETAMGKVIGYESVKNYGKNSTRDDLYPVLKFQNAQGKTMEVRSDKTINHAYDTLGVQYLVRYSKKDPTFVAPAASERSLAGAVFLCFVGIIPLSFGAVSLRQFFA